jgi:hypothetical protein
MKTLVKSQYNPARGGHAPSDLRDAFLKTVEAVFDWSTGEPEPTVEVREGKCLSVRSAVTCGTAATFCPQAPWTAWTLISAAGLMRRLLVCSSR